MNAPEWRVLAVLVLFAAAHHGLARECSPPNGDYILRIKTQAELNTMSDCTIFVGDLVLGNDSLSDGKYNYDIVSLEPLANLTRIIGDGAIELRYLRGITNVDGLRNLEYVADNVEIMDTGLTNVDGLSGKLSYIGQELRVYFNEYLTNLDGFVYTTMVGDEISIQGNSKLVNVDGVWFNTQIRSLIEIIDNHALCDVHFKEWQEKFKDFTIVENNADEKNCKDRLPPSVAAPPTVVDLQSRNATLSWPKLDNAHGLIIAYEAVATEVHGGNVTNHAYMNYTLPSPFNKTFTHTVTGLRPYTLYRFAIAAFDIAGSTIGNDTDALMTLEDAPEDVQVPTIARIFSRMANVTWGAPLRPNGVIRGYSVGVTAADPWNPSVIRRLQFDTGANDMMLQIDGLFPDTDYQVVLTAWTAVGNTSSLPAFFTTRPGTPDYHENCIRFQLQGLYTAVVKWDGCFRANDRQGLSRYEVHLNGTLVYKGVLSEFLADELVRPGEPQAFIVTAFNRVSFTQSDPAILLTPPSPPTDVPRPTVTVHNETALLVTWLSPVHPNGIVTLYELSVDGTVVCAGMIRSCIVGGLASKQTYTFVVSVHNLIGSATSAALVATMPTGGFLGSGISGGAIAGIILGIVGFMVSVFVVFVWRKRREHRLALEAYKRSRKERARQKRERQVESVEMDGRGVHAHTDEANMEYDADDTRGVL
eukprot:Opistho-2@86600